MRTTKVVIKWDTLRPPPVYLQGRDHIRYIYSVDSLGNRRDTPDSATMYIDTSVVRTIAYGDTTLYDTTLVTMSVRMSLRDTTGQYIGTISQSSLVLPSVVNVTTVNPIERIAVHDPLLYQIGIFAVGGLVGYGIAVVR